MTPPERMRPLSPTGRSSGFSLLDRLSKPRTDTIYRNKAHVTTGIVANNIIEWGLPSTVYNAWHGAASEQVTERKSSSRLWW
jgi:hypothetical protein